MAGEEVAFGAFLFMSMQDRMDWINIAIDLVILNCYSLNC